VEKGVILYRQWRSGMMIEYKAGYKFDPDGVHAEVLDFPGAISCGTDLADARMMLADALAIMAETYIQDGSPVPKPDPSVVNSSMDVVEPIYLNLLGSTQPLPEPAEIAHEVD
jgi:predicted RNase H-like HicB family nuclease